MLSVVASIILASSRKKGKKKKSYSTTPLFLLPRLRVCVSSCVQRQVPLSAEMHLEADAKPARAGMLSKRLCSDSLRLVVNYVLSPPSLPAAPNRMPPRIPTKSAGFRLRSSLGFLRGLEVIAPGRQKKSLVMGLK